MKKALIILVAILGVVFIFGCGMSGSMDGYHNPAHHQNNDR